MKSFVSRISTSLVLAGALAVAAVLPASADNRNFTLINSTGTSLVNLFVSPTDTIDWGVDILGKDTLGPDEQWDITFGRFEAGKCLYDVKVVTKDGAEGKLIGIDLCTVTTVTFNP